MFARLVVVKCQQLYRMENLHCRIGGKREVKRKVFFFFFYSDGVAFSSCPLHPFAFFCFMPTLSSSPLFWKSFQLTLLSSGKQCQCLLKVFNGCLGILVLQGTASKLAKLHGLLVILGGKMHTSLTKKKKNGNNENQ